MVHASYDRSFLLVFVWSDVPNSDHRLFLSDVPNLDKFIFSLFHFANIFFAWGR
jgi:hypothetical protein